MESVGPWARQAYAFTDSLGAWRCENNPHHSKSKTRPERCTEHRLPTPVRGPGFQVAKNDMPTGGSAPEVLISHTEFCPLACPAGDWPALGARKPQRTARPTLGAAGFSVYAQSTARPSGVIPGTCSPAGPSAEAGNLQKTDDLVPGGWTMLRWLWPAQKVTEQADGKDGHMEGPPCCLLEGEPPSLGVGSSGLGQRVGQDPRGVGHLKIGSRGKPNPGGQSRPWSPEDRGLRSRLGWRRRPAEAHGL